MTRGRIQELIHKVGRGKEGAEPLTFDEAYEMGKLLLEGKLTPRQEGAFLMAMRVKSEEPQEIAGLTKALRETGEKLRAGFKPLEIPSYAGKKDSLNVLPAAALIARAAGVPVLVHGRKEEPERTGSEEVFEALQIPTGLSIGELRPPFERARFGFLRVDRFHPTLAAFLGAKLELGVRSSFFVVSRLSNPAGSDRILAPITHKPYFEKYEEALKALDVELGIIFFSNEGEAELPYHGALTGVEVRRGHSRSIRFKPSERVRFDDALRARDPGAAADATREILSGTPSSASLLATLTAGLYLYAFGQTPDLDSGVSTARRTLASRAPVETLRSIQSTYRG